MAEIGPPPRHRPDLTCRWWVIGALAAWFALLAFIAHGPNTLAIDDWASDRVQNVDGALAGDLARLGDFLGERTLALGLLAVAWVGLALAKQRRDLWFIGLAAVGRLLALPLKAWFESPRPTIEQVELARSFDELGFPSGHAMTSAVTLGALAYLIARRAPDRTVRLGLFGLWMLGIAITAYARIWYGAHWLTDTIGGATYGITVVLLAANLSAMIAKEGASETQTRPRQTPAPQPPTTA